MLCNFTTTFGILRMFWNEAVSMSVPFCESLSPCFARKSLLNWLKPHRTSVAALGVGGWISVPRLPEPYLWDCTVPDDPTGDHTRAGPTKAG